MALTPETVDKMMTITRFPATQHQERRRIAKQLRRIRVLRQRGLMTWDDHVKEQQLRRRLVDLDLAKEEA